MNEREIETMKDNSDAVIYKDVPGYANPYNGDTYELIGLCEECEDYAGSEYFEPLGMHLCPDCYKDVKQEYWDEIRANKLGGK